MSIKKWVISLLILLLVSAGCVPGQAVPQLSPTTQPETISPTGAPLPATPPPPSPTVPAPLSDPSAMPGDPPDAALKARDSLAHELSISPKLVLIRSVDAVDWPDTCLGAPAKDEMCAQIVVPGYQVILDARGQTYEYHTNQDGSMMRAKSENQNTEDNPAVAQAVIAKAAQDLALEAAALKVVRIDAVEWPDSCLGVQVKGMMCLMVITPGYRVIVETGGQNYEYHTDRTARRIVRFMGK